MAERGEYRSIPRALLAGKDFRALPERMRWVFVALKMNMGFVGVETWYPDELVSRLSHETGATVDQVRLALDYLEHENWIRREDNVIWIVGHITHDPHVTPTNPKHRTGVQRHVAGLPRISIVRAFMEYHPEWFPEAEAIKMGLVWSAVATPIPLPPSPMGTGTHSIPMPNRNRKRSTSRKRNTNTDNPDSGESVSLVEKPWPAEAADIWSTNVTPISPARCGHALKPVVEKYGWPDTKRGLLAFIECTEGRAQKLEWYAGAAVRWVEKIGPMPPNDANGLTERGEMIRLNAQRRSA